MARRFSIRAIVKLSSRVTVNITQSFIATALTI
jgi:hypothetical protein